jgi:hypothetical protein
MLLAAAVIIIGGAGGIVIGLRLRPADDAGAGPDSAGGYRPAPPPSSLVRPDPVAAAVSERPAPALPAARRGDPLAPVSAESLEARHARSFAASQAQLQSELRAVGLDNVFGVRSFATPEGARAGRRIVAAALNVVGQFHRREVMIDQAYRDTAAFQSTRAGWSRAERDAWDARPTLREAYAAADLAESLLADADSLLSILSGAESYEVRGDTIRFADPAVAASYRAQRSRIAQRSGEPVGDPDRRPTLALVRRSVDPLVLPEGAPRRGRPGGGKGGRLLPAPPARRRGLDRARDPGVGVVPLLAKLTQNSRPLHLPLEGLDGPLDAVGLGQPDLDH